MNIITDAGGGITELSLEKFQEAKGQLGELLHMWIYRDDLFNVPDFGFELAGTEGVLLLSGCNCGYGGTGPHGSAKILKAIVEENWQNGVISERRMKDLLEQEKLIYGQGRILIKFPEGMRW